MFVVGVELTPDDLRGVAARPRFVAGATIAQLVFLPMVAAGLVIAFQPDDRLAAGMILVAISPSGAISNAFALLARANLALSVVLTAVSNLTSVATMPVLAAVGFHWLLAKDAGIHAPMGPIFGQLLLLMVMPILLGFELCRRGPDLVERARPLLAKAALAGVFALIALVLFDQWEMVKQVIGEVLIYAAMFTALAMVGGYVVGVALRADRRDRVTLMFELSSRNLAIVTVVAAQALGRLDVVVFAVAFFLVQAPLALAVAAVHRLVAPSISQRVADRLP